MEQTFVLEEKRIEEVFDVVVVGGGLSGVMAAIAVTEGISPKQVSVQKVQSVLQAHGGLF